MDAEEVYGFSDFFTEMLNRGLEQQQEQKASAPVSDSEPEVTEEEPDFDLPEEDWESKYGTLESENSSLRQQLEDAKYNNNELLAGNDLLTLLADDGASLSDSVLSMVESDIMNPYTAPESDSPKESQSIFKTKTPRVDASELNSDLKAYMSNLPPALRDKLLITSANDDKHAPNSKHYSNNAVDLRFSPDLYKHIANDPVAKKMGITVLDPNHGTAPHIHLEKKKYGGKKYCI